jgi:hypothetical protein
VNANSMMTMLAKRRTTRNAGERAVRLNVGVLVPVSIILLID